MFSLFKSATSNSDEKQESNEDFSNSSSELENAIRSAHQSISCNPSWSKGWGRYASCQEVSLDWNLATLQRFLFAEF